MAIEKFFIGVSTTPFTSNGNARGQITVASAAGFKVKMDVLIASTTQDTITLEIKRVLSGTLIEVGEIGKQISHRSDISAYLVADGASITAPFQAREAIPLQDINRATYEEEPTVAVRVVQVDQYGNILGGTGGVASDVNLRDGFGNPITSTTVGLDQGLDVNILNDITVDVDALTGDSVRIYGVDGGAVQREVIVDTTGRLEVVVTTLPAVTQGTNPWVVAIDQTGTNNDVDVLTLPAVTLASQPSPFTTSVDVNITGGSSSGQQVLDNQLAVSLTDLGNIIAGFDGTNYQFISTDVNGELQVDVLTLPNVVLASQISPFTTDVEVTLNGEQVDVSDRAARLLGVVCGSQGQQLQQTAVDFNLQVELATGGTLYDARQIRALTAADIVTVQQGTLPWVVGIDQTGTNNDVDVLTLPSVVLASQPSPFTTPIDVTISGGSSQQVLDGQLAVPLTDTGNIAVGFDGTNYQFISTDVLGQLQVDVLTLPNVVLASQVNPFTTPFDVNLQDGAGNDITSQVNGTQQALDVGINVAGVQIDPRQIRALIASDVVTAAQGTAAATAGAWPIKVTDGTTVAAVHPQLSSLKTTEAEEQTFVAYASNVTIGNGKSMISILNATGTSVNIRIKAIYIMNAQTSAVTGVVADFNIFRITGHSAGTSITPSAYDTADTLNSNVTVRTGATIAGEGTAILRRWLWSSDDWGTGTLDVEAAEHISQNVIAAYSPQLKDKPITLRTAEGLTIKQVTNSTAGQFDIMVLFTQV